MIITCDNCQTRYLVPTHSLGPDGRAVRCTRCRHEWFQTLEDEQDGGDDGKNDAALPPEENLEPIPESVKPLPEGSSLPAIPGDDVPGEGGDYSRLIGYATAAGVFFLIFGVLLGLRGPLTHVWPASAGFYNMVGLAPGPPGKGLIFDHLQAVTALNKEGINVLNIQGNIINLENKEAVIPAVQTALRMSDGSVYDTWLVELTEHHAGPQGDVSFHTAYPEVPADVREVTVRFVLGR